MAKIGPFPTAVKIAFVDPTDPDKVWSNSGVTYVALSGATFSDYTTASSGTANTVTIPAGLAASLYLVCVVFDSGATAWSDGLGSFPYRAEPLSINIDGTVNGDWLTIDDPVSADFATGADIDAVIANFPVNFSVMGINSSGHVSRVTLVDTTTTNSDMRGTNGALLSGSYTAPNNAGIAAIKAVADLFVFTGGNVNAVLTGDQATQLAAAGGQSGDGDTEVDHNTGGVDALAYKTSGGVGIDNATIRAYTTADYTAGNYTVRAESITDSNGRWVTPMYLNDGVAYTLTYSATGYTVVTHTVTP